MSGELRHCECGRELEKYQHYCSECAHIRRQISYDKCMADSERSKKHIARVREWQIKNNKTRAEWKELAKKPMCI